MPRHGRIRLLDVAASRSTQAGSVWGRVSCRVAGIDLDEIVDVRLAAMRDLPTLLEGGSLEDRKELVSTFVEGITVVPDESRLDLRIRKIPALSPGNSTCLMVAGARFEQVQIPAGALIAGKRGLRCAV